MQISDLITSQAAAILPAPILWAAAQFASKDQNKAALCQIQLTRSNAGAVTVRSCDGHRAFRVTLPAEMAHATADELLIPAGEWSKPGKLLTAAEWLCLRTDGTAAALSHAGQPVELRSYQPDAYAPQFPNIDQIWPDSFHCEPGTIMGANAAYLGSFCTVASKLSPNGCITLETNDHTTAAQLTANYRDTDFLLQFLLMPVQLRSDEHRARHEAKAERDRQRARNEAERLEMKAASLARLPQLAGVAA